MTVEILKIIWALLTTVVLVYVFARIFTRRQVLSGSSLVVKNIGYLGLGPRRGILILKAGREVLLLGVTQTEIKLLRAYPAEELGIGEGRPERTPEEEGKFKRLLSGGLFNEKTPH